MSEATKPNSITADVLMYADGGGDGQVAIVWKFPGNPEEHGRKKQTVAVTNNEAEWESLLFALSSITWYHNTVIHMDSQLVVRQFNDEYKTKNPRMAAYKKRCQDLLKRKQLNVRVTWVRREDNKAGWVLER